MVDFYGIPFEQTVRDTDYTQKAIQNMRRILYIRPQNG